MISSEYRDHDVLLESDLFALQRNLQREHPNEAVFTAVLCPVLESGQRGRQVMARCKLDTGSDYNIISKEYVTGEKLGELVVEIPDNEQVSIPLIGGATWKPNQKIYGLRFYLINSMNTQAGDFFLESNLGFDLLISQKYFKAVVSEQARDPGPRVLWIPKFKRTPGDVLKHALRIRSLIEF
jgi:hypothetical protein